MHLISRVNVLGFPFQSLNLFTCPHQCRDTPDLNFAMFWCFQLAMTLKSLKLAFVFPTWVSNLLTLQQSSLLPHWNANSLPVPSYNFPWVNTRHVFQQFVSKVFQSRAEQVPAGPGIWDKPHRTKQVPCITKEKWIVCLAFCSAIAHIWTTLSPLPRLRSQLPMVSSTMNLHLGKLGDCIYIHEKPIVYRYYLESGKGFSSYITSILPVNYFC